MTKYPLIGSFVLFIALCASTAYWALHYLQPAPRAIIAPPPAAVVAPELSAAATLLGGGHGTAASNFQLTGIIVSDHPNESIAIIAIDGKPAKPMRTHAEISPGVSVQEIQRGFVLLSDHGASKRLDLPANNKQPSGINMSITSPAPPTGTGNTMPNPAANAPLPNPGLAPDQHYRHGKSF